LSRFRMLSMLRIEGLRMVR